MNTRLVKLGAVGVLCVFLGAGALYYFGVFDPPPPPPAQPKQAKPPPDPDPVEPTAVQTDTVLRLVGEARRLAAAGKFDEANAALDRAEKVIPGQAEVATARAEIAQLRTPEGRLAQLLQRARLAVEHDELAAAEQALAEAEKLKPDSPEIATLRTEMKTAADRRARRANRIGELLKSMRAAIARGDFTAADGALNNAERIDMQDPDVQRARVELRRAHEADRRQRDQQKGPPPEKK